MVDGLGLVLAVKVAAASVQDLDATGTERWVNTDAEPGTHGAWPHVLCVTTARRQTATAADLSHRETSSVRTHRAGEQLIQPGERIVRPVLAVHGVDE